MAWTKDGWRTDAGAECPGAPGQPEDMHDMWGCGRCNPITRDAAEGAER